MAEHPTREAHVNFIGGRQRKELTHIPKNSIEYQRYHNARTQDPQGGFTLMG